MWRDTTTSLKTFSGFRFGDYFDLTIDYLGRTQGCWGEGFNYDSPGSIWYTRQLK